MIQELEQKRSAIDTAILALQGIHGSEAPHKGRPRGSRNRKSESVSALEQLAAPNVRKPMSEETRRKISASHQKRVQQGHPKTDGHPREMGDQSNN